MPNDIQKIIDQNVTDTSQQSSLTPTPIANSQTSSTVASSPAPSYFQIPVQDDVLSTTLQGNTTYSDVQAFRKQLESQQRQAGTLDQIEQPLSEPSVFNDPQKYIEATLFGDRQPTTAEKLANQYRGDIADITGDISKNLTSTETTATKEVGLTAREKALAETNTRIAERSAQFRRELRAFEEDAARRGVDRQFVQSEKDKLQADATAELADLYIIQEAQQGNLDSARSYIETAVNNRYRSIQLDLQTKQAELQRLIPTLEGEAKDRATKLQIALSERENNLANEREEAKSKRELMIELANMGASSALQSKVVNAPTLDQAYELTADFIGRSVRSAAAAKAAAGTGYKPPTIKTINGTDYQWNEQLGIWEVPTGVGGLDAASSVDNISFLRGVTSRILGTGEYADDPLYKGAGQSVLAQSLGRFFKGQTATSRLEAQVDTLRANMLSLATDPSIKEFFGPQMSDADVRLMTAAGTTLRPDSQTPKELREEATRIDDLLNRMQTAVTNGVNSRQNVITAPDGTLVEIID